MQDQIKLKQKKPQFLITPKIIIKPEIKLDQLIEQLKTRGQTSQDKMVQLLQSASNILHNQPNILYLTSPYFIIGDIHGQFYDLLYLIEKYAKFPETRFLFLGDYVDRGLFCVEVMTLLLALKCKYPKSIYLLRGNHQGKAMTEHYNFKLQCAKKFNVDFYERFLELFCKFPIAALLDNKYFCVHGGISPQLKKLKQINSLDRFKEIQPTGLMCDLLWSDPANNNSAIWMCSFMFSKTHAQKFITQNKIELIIRAHEMQRNGFSYQIDDLRRKLTLTIFSAPNYCGVSKNKGGIAIIDKNTIRIESFSQSSAPFVFPNYMNVLEWSLPIIGQKVSKILLHLLKYKKNGKEFAEDELLAMSKLEGLSHTLQSQELENFQLLKSQRKENQTGLLDSGEGRNIQKYPQNQLTVIGPKHIEFKRIRISDDDENSNEEDLVAV